MSSSRPRICEPDAPQPGLEQAAGVLGTDVGGDLALAGGALADRPLGDLQHGRRIGGGAVLAGSPSRARARVASAIAACAHLAALPCSPPASRRAAAQVAQKLFRRGGRGRLGEGAADVHAGVVVGAADAGPAVGLDVDGGGHVQLRGPRPVADLPDREQLREAAAVALGQRGADVVEGVRERAGDPVLVEGMRRRPRRRRNVPAATRGPRE